LIRSQRQKKKTRKKKKKKKNLFRFANNATERSRAAAKKENKQIEKNEINSNPYGWCNF
jgi:hypothetical protein